MSSSAVWMAAKRQRAREAGLCVVCCKSTRKPGSSSCENCAKSAVQRRAKRRKELRRARESQEIIIAHELAGDKAKTHHLHADAAQHYNEALNLPGIAQADRL